MKKVIINVKTVPNGYTLDINDNGYMYHDIDALLAGFVKHVGLKSRECSDPEAIKNLIAAMATWPDATSIAYDSVHLIEENKRMKEKTIGQTNHIHALNDRLYEANEKLRHLKEDYKRLDLTLQRLLKQKNKVSDKNIRLSDVQETSRKNEPSEMNITTKERIRREVKAEKKRVPYTEELYKLLTMPLRDTKLKGAILNKVSLGWIYKTVGEVVEHDKNHFRASRGCGPLSLKAFEEWMLQKNLFWRMDVQYIIDEHEKRKKK